MKKGIIIAIVVIFLIIVFIVYQKWQMSVANSVVRESGIDVSNIVRMEYSTTVQDGPELLFDEYEDSKSLANMMNELEDMQYVMIDSYEEMESVSSQYINFSYQNYFMIIEDSKGTKNEIILYDFREYNSMFAVVINTRWRVFWVSEEDALCNTIFNKLKKEYDLEYYYIGREY